MSTRHKTVRFAAVCAVLLSLVLSVHAGPPKGVDYRIVITSDGEVYLVGNEVIFTVNPSKWKDEKELPFNIQGKDLLAFFPTKENPVALKDEGDNTWIYKEALQVRRSPKLMTEKGRKQVEEFPPSQQQENLLKGGGNGRGKESKRGPAEGR